MHIYSSVNKAIIGHDNALLPEQLHAIISTNDGVLLIRNLRTNFR